MTGNKLQEIKLAKNEESPPQARHHHDAAVVAKVGEINKVCRGFYKLHRGGDCQSVTNSPPRLEKPPLLLWCRRWCVGEAGEKAGTAGECGEGATASPKKSPKKFSGGGWPEAGPEFEIGEKEGFCYPATIVAAAGKAAVVAVVPAVVRRRGRGEGWNGWRVRRRRGSLAEKVTRKVFRRRLAGGGARI
nr:hypothetical protein [Tanacetum cinerariifolium]